MDKQYKEFEDIFIGDFGEDLYGNHGEVIFYGTAQEVALNYKSGTLSDKIESGFVDPNYPAVAVRINGEIYTYPYDEDNFMCFCPKIQEEERLKIIQQIFGEIDVYEK